MIERANMRAGLSIVLLTAMAWSPVAAATCPPPKVNPVCIPDAATVTWECDLTNYGDTTGASRAHCLSRAVAQTGRVTPCDHGRRSSGGV